MDPNPPSARGRVFRILGDGRGWLVGHRLILVGIVVLAAGLRLWNLEAAQYTYDEELVVSRAWGLVREGIVPTNVPASLGVSNGPIAPLVLAIPMLVSTSHGWLAAFVAGINVAAIPLAYLVGRNLFGVRAGLLLALLVAVNPWLVAASRRLWLNALLAPSVTLLLWATHRALQTGGWRAWALLGAAAAVNAQIHLSSLANLPALAGALLPFVGGVRKRGLAVAALVAGLVMIPWVLTSVVPDLLGLQSSRYDPSVPAEETSLDRVSLLVTGVGYQTLTGHSARIIDSTSPPFQALDILAHGLALAGWVWLVATVWRERQRDVARAATCLLVALMVALPVVVAQLMVSLHLLGYPHWWYFFNLAPGLLLGVAAVTDWVWSRRRWLGVALGAAVAGPHLLLAYPFLAAQEEYWPKAQYDVPWKYNQAYIEQIERLAEPERAFVVVGGVGWDEYVRAEVVARILGREYGPVRMIDPRDGLIYRTDRAVALVATTDEDHLLTRFVQDGLRAPEVFYQRIPGHGWIRRVFRVERGLVEGWAARNLRELQPPRSDGGGVTYERAGLIGLGGRTYLGLVWRFDADPTEPILTETIFTAEGRELHREVHLAYPAVFWQRGDWLDTRMVNVFELPETLDPRRAMTLTLERQGASGRRAGSPVRIELEPVEGALTLTLSQKENG